MRDRAAPDRRARPGPTGKAIALFTALLTALAAALAASTVPAGEAATEDARPTARTTPAASTPDPAPRPLVVHATGDVNLDPSYIPALREHGYAHAWSGLDGLFTTDDVTVVNMECPVSDQGAIVPKQFTFRCDPAALPAAVDAGVDVANQANNHVLDYGPAAMLDSLARLRAAGIAPVGAGADVDAANAPALLAVDGRRVAVLGFGGVVPAFDWLAGPDSPGMSSGDDIASMTAAVRAADAVADLVLVAIHWGAELDTQPRPEDVERAHAMIDAGADAIFGHHAHRLQPLGWYRGRPIAWGLGNFVWPSLSAAGSRSAVARVVFEPDGAVQACLLPVTITSHGHPELTGPRGC